MESDSHMSPSHTEEAASSALHTHSSSTGSSYSSIHSSTHPASSTPLHSCTPLPSTPSVSPADVSPRFEDAAAHGSSPLAATRVGNHDRLEANSYKVNQSSIDGAAEESLRQQGKQHSATNGRDNQRKHSNSSSSHPTTNFQGDELFPTSLHDVTSVQQPSIISSSSSTTASSLPGDVPTPLLTAPLATAGSTLPLSANSQQNSVQHGSFDSSNQAQQHDVDNSENKQTTENNNISKSASSKKSKFPPASDSNPSSSSALPVVVNTTPAATSLAQMTSKQRLNAKLLSLFSDSHAASDLPSLIPSSASSSAASSSSSSTFPSLPSSSLSSLHFLSLDTTCHCLVVDESLLSSSDAEQYRSLLELGQAAAKVDKTTLTQRVWSWLNTDMNNTQAEQALCVAYVKENSLGGVGANQRVLHLNFNSSSALIAAASKHSFLCRCGTTRSSAWARTRPCGPEKGKLPELLQFSCIPTQMNNLKNLTADVTKLLEEAGLSHTCLWFPQHQDARIGASVYNNKTTHLSFYILPRHFDSNTLNNIIMQHHNKLILWGGRLRIHAPNTPSLSRCTQCEELGHQPTSCPQYKGVGIRLLFKDPVPYAALLQLVQQSKARIGYLGQGTNESTPHRKVTLLFDVSSDEEDENGFQTIQQHMSPLVSALRSRLHQAPSVVRPIDRSRECRECGQLGKPHECPFIGGNNRTVARVGAAAAPSSSTSSSSSASASKISSSSSSVSRSSLSSSDDMCKSWRRSKTCPRRDKGHTCLFKHPDEHNPEQHCFDFAQHGHCSRGTLCRYLHVQPQVQLATSKQTTQQTNKQAHNVSTHTLPAAPTLDPSNSSSAAVSSSSSSSLAPTVTATGAVEASSSSSSSSSGGRASSKRKQTATNTDNDAVSQPPDPTAEEEATSSAEQDSSHTTSTTASASPQKKRKDTTAAAASSSSSSSFIHSTRWSDLNDDEEEEQEESTTQQSPAVKKGKTKSQQKTAMVPTSSLASITSPAKQPSRTSSTSSTTAAAANATSANRK